MKKYEFRKETSTMLKGLLAIGIIFHHLAQRSDTVTNFFISFGKPITALFFFISGYGLLSSLSKNKEKYMHDFLNKRFISLLIPFLVSIVIFQTALYINTNSFDIKLILKDLFQGKTDSFLPFSWYVFEIIYFYLVFYFVFRYSKSNLIGNILLTGLFSFFLIYGFRFIHFGDWWYAASLAFTFGLFCKYLECNPLKKQKLNSKFFIVILLCTLLIIPIFNIKYMVATFVVPYFIYFLIMHIHIPDNKILLFLGKISYEIYLIQGIAVFLLRGNLVYIKNDNWYIVFTFIITIPLAILTNKISLLIKKIVLNKNFLQQQYSFKKV